MLPQQNYGGYQPTEEEIQQSQINPLVSALGITGAGAGGGFLIDTERRRRASGGAKDFSAAAKESVDDLGTALRILTGRSAYDKLDNPDGFRPNISGLTPADAEFRSMRDYASQSAPGTFYSLGNTSNPFSQFAIAARDAYQPSSEDFLSSIRDLRTSRGRSAEGPRSSVALTRIPLVDAYRDLGAGKVPFGFTPDEMAFRKDSGIALMKDNLPQALGSAAGRTASDFINNGARSLWWLVNAPQAVSDLFSEEITGRANRFGLYGQDLYSYDEAKAKGLIDEKTNEPRNNSINLISDKTKDAYLKSEIERIRSGVRDKAGNDPIDRKKLNVYGKRRTGNNLSTLLALPSAVAINAGLGLVNPIGGSDGYKAVLPSEDDPTQTRNVIGEVASKYILGRRGDILPWEEFKKVRPDVSKDDYMAYKAYKYNKGVDLNPFDGDWNLGGIAKGTDDGIEGGEVMFLGKHMPTDTVLFPTLAAAVGAAGGAALGRGGWANLEGINEGQKRRGAQRSQIANDYGLPDDFELDSLDETVLNRITDNDKKLLGQIDRQTDRAEARQGVIEKVLDSLPGRDMGEDLGSRRNRLSRRNPITLGLIGGTAALAGASLIGHENERRRREEKIRERQERGY